MSILLFQTIERWLIFFQEPEQILCLTCFLFVLYGLPICNFLCCNPWMNQFCQASCQQVFRPCQTRKFQKNPIQDRLLSLCLRSICIGHMKAYYNAFSYLSKPYRSKNDFYVEHFRVSS